MTYPLIALVTVIAMASPAPTDVIRIVHAPTPTATGYALSVVENGNVQVDDDRGKLLREAHISNAIASALFSTVAMAPPLNTLKPGSCGQHTELTAPTYLQWGGLATPDLQCGGSGFLAMIWGFVQQIIGNIGLGGGKSGGSGSFGGLGNLGGLGSLGIPGL